MKHFLPIALASLALSSAAHAQWWINGGGGGRMGRPTVFYPDQWVGEPGPDNADLAWSVSIPSLRTSQPLTDSERVVTIRHTSDQPGPGDATLFVHSVQTGQQLWSAPIPFAAGDDHAVLLGAAGRVYVTRGSRERGAPIYGFDISTGAFTFISEPVRTDADGFSWGADRFIVSEPTRLLALDPDTGAQIWQQPRQTPPDAHLGIATRSASRFYCIEAVPGGHVVARYNFNGIRIYQSEVLPGDTALYPPMFVENSWLYIQHGGDPQHPAKLYGLVDTDQRIEMRWTQSIGASRGGESAALFNRSTITVGPGNTIERRDPFTGQLIARSQPLSATPIEPVFAIDPLNIVYIADRANGRLHALDSGMFERFPSVSHPGIRGLALNDDGTLIVADRNGIYAYRTLRPPPPDCPPCFADWDESGGIDGDDIYAFYGDWLQGLPCTDLDRSGGVDLDDVYWFFDEFLLADCLL